VDCLQVVTTTDSREEADRLARSAVERRLAACAQVVGPVTSTYRWEGAVETASEWQCVLKTTAARFDELRAHLEREHTYETPEIVATPIVAGGAAYLEWIERETAAGAG
jgi:periplasmic divalent cation tolerance protein